MRGGNLCEIVPQCPNIWIDTHIVIIEYHEDIGILRTSIMKPLKGEASRHGAITDHGNMMFLVFSLCLARYSHTEGG